MVNLIPKIAKMLGVELGEDFKIKDNHDNSLSNETYKFSKDALLYKYQDTDADAYCLASSFTLYSLLTGDVEVSKLPWKPKEGDYYYYFDLLCDKWIVRTCMWLGLPYEYALLDKGWVYKTCEEAEAALPKVATEIGVNYEI